MMWALVIDGIVHELTETDPTDRFHETLVWVECSADIQLGWSFVDGVFSGPPAASLADVKKTRIAALTTNCSAAIVGGYPSSALGEVHTYPSGITDQINMMGSVTASLLPGLAEDWTTPFWCADDAGVWQFRMHSINQIRQAGSDGKMHVVTCQATLDGVTAMVTASTTTAMVDAVAWPTAT